MWSLGVVFYQLLLSHHPFCNVNQTIMFRNIKNGNIGIQQNNVTKWNITSDEMKDFYYVHHKHIQKNDIVQVIKEHNKKITEESLSNSALCRDVLSELKACASYKIC